MLEAIAAAESTLSADERELGVCLLDIGAHSSDIAVFFEGAVAYTASVPIGGAHFTNDLAIGLQMPVAQAEELKRQYGNAVVTAVPQLAEIEITSPKPYRLALRTVAEILEPRARELMYYVRESLRHGGVFDAMGAGCVLTGGGAMLPGMLDVTESQLRVPARTGMPLHSVAHARGTESSIVGSEYRHDFVRASHARHARRGRQSQPGREAESNVCGKFLETGNKGPRERGNEKTGT